MDDVNAWVPQSSTFGPLLFLIYIHDLTDDLSNIKLFYTPLCSVVYNVNTLTDEVNNDLVKINKWTYQLKMSFNPDPIKQAHVLYTGKISKKDHPHWFLNNNVSEANSQKSWGII